MTLKNLFGYNILDRLIRFAPADVLAWLFPGGSSTTTDLNVRDLTSNRDFHVGNAFSVLSGTGVTHAQQLSVFGSPNGGRAQVEVQTVDGFQTTALQNWRDHDGDVICSVMPDGFAGPAPGITTVPAASLTGTLDNARLSGVALTGTDNTFTGTLTATGFVGDGAGLNNVAKLAGGNAFTAPNTIATAGGATSPALTVTCPDPVSPYVGLSVLSGTSGSYTGIGVGRTTTECWLVVAGTADQYLGSSLAGDICLIHSGSLRFGSSIGDTTRIVFDTSGNILATGNLTANGRLNVGGNAAASTFLTGGSTGNSLMTRSSVGNTTSLEVHSPDDSRKFYLSVAQASGSGNPSVQMGTYTDHDWGLYGNLQEALRITAAGAVTVNPNAATSAGSVPLTVKATDNGTNLQEWRNQSGITVASVGPNGAFSATGFDNVYVNGVLDITPGGDDVPLTVRSSTGQTADLTEWKDDSDNVLAGVAADGSITTAGTVKAASFSGSGTSLTGVALTGSANTFTQPQTVGSLVISGDTIGVQGHYLTCSGSTTDLAAYVGDHLRLGCWDFGTSFTPVLTIAANAATITGPLTVNGAATATGQVRMASLGVGNSAAGSTLGTVVKKVEIFDASGTSLGFVPVYDAIT